MIEVLEDRLAPATVSVIHSFAGPTTDGSAPEFARLMADSQGNLFGTAYQGGAGSEGTAFELVKNGNSYNENILYSFYVGGSPDGANPSGGLIADASGDLFGVAQNGGAHVLGTVYELVKNVNSYTENVLYSFAGGASDGANPYGSLIMDKNGNLFGTTDHGGGSGVGTVYEMVKNGNSYNAPTILHSFAGGSDGAFLQFGLAADGAGDLFGTTNQGGGTGSNGTIFEMVNNAGSYTKTTLYSFAGSPADGGSPYGTLFLDGSGNIFGATHGGGTSNVGTVYELAKSGTGYSSTDTVLYSFAGGNTDGGFPDAGVIADANGNLFGTTSLHGPIINGSGMVFELVKNGSSYTENVLHYFAGGTTDGNEPASDLVADANGNIFGTTIVGGAGNNNGTVFEVSGLVAGPTVTGINPSVGHAAGGTSVTITGTNLIGATAVHFGSATGTIVSDTGTQIVATSPPGLAGTVVDVTVTTAQGTSGVSSADKFTYLTAHQLFVYNAYHLLLNRVPESSGLALWTGLLDSGVAPSTVVQAIEQAPTNEYQTDLVTSLYVHYLGRSPDSAGLNYWVSQLVGGATIESVTATILGSLEYFVDKSGTNAGFVTGLYNDVLGRSADSAGSSAWVAALNSGLARSQAALSFLTSTEYRTDLVKGGTWTTYSPLTNWGGYYPEFLRRSADAGGLSYWTQQLAAGMSDQAVLAALFGSAEGYALWS